MKHTEEEIKEIKRYAEIGQYKDKIKCFIKEFVKQEKNLNILSLEEEVTANRLYCSVIAKLNESFYGFNVSDLVKDLRSRKITVPDGNIVNVLPPNHLRYYHQMIRSYFKTITNSNVLNHDSFIAIGKKIGNDAYNYFNQENNNVTPYQDLLISLLNEKEELYDIKESLKKLKLENKQLKKENKVLKKERK